MQDQPSLSNLILKHWCRYRPSMVEELRRENRLETALAETTDQFSELLYQLLSVRKMEYHQAWEIAVEQFLLPEESFSTPNPKLSLPATSG